MGTLSESISVVLRRTRLSTSVDTHKDRARGYLNTAASENWPLVPWWFLDRTVEFKTTKTLTITSATGTFAAGDTITGSSSGKTAVVDSYDSTNGLLYVYSESGAFTASETITSSGGGSATHSSTANTRTYTPISGPVTSWWSAVNVTEDEPITIVGPDRYDGLDFDRDETGTVEAVYIGSMDATTGYPILELWRTPDTTNETMRVRYHMDIAAWTSSDDSSSMQVLGIPRILESVIQYRAEQLYMEEERNFDGSAIARNNYNQAMAAAIKQNRSMQGRRRYARKGAYEEGELTIGIGTDTVTAA